MLDVIARRCAQRQPQSVRPSERDHRNGAVSVSSPGIGGIDEIYCVILKPAPSDEQQELVRFFNTAPQLMRDGRIPTMPISHSDLMPIRAERSDAGLSQCEIVIDIRQEFCRFSLR
jgi:hypothetical protein